MNDRIRRLLDRRFARLTMCARQDEIAKIRHRIASGGSLESVSLTLPRAAAMSGVAIERDHADRPLYASRGGVAVLDISGAIVENDDIWCEIFGDTPAPRLIEAMHRLVDDDAVHSVVLDIDSPGGHASCAPELAVAMDALRASKPTVAMARHTMCSLAYWIGCMADQIVATQFATVGSIGAAAFLVDTSEAHAKAGIRVVPVASGAGKVDGAPGVPVGDLSITETQEAIDEIAARFTEHVAQMRGITPDTINAWGGRTFTGTRAVELGLADRVGTIDQLIEGLLSQPRTTTPTQRAATIAAARATGGAIMANPTDPNATPDQDLTTQDQPMPPEDEPVSQDEPTDDAAGEPMTVEQLLEMYPDQMAEYREQIAAETMPEDGQPAAAAQLRELFAACPDRDTLAIEALASNLTMTAARNKAVQILGSRVKTLQDDNNNLQAKLAALGKGVAPVASDTRSAKDDNFEAAVRRIAAERKTSLPEAVAMAAREHRELHAQWLKDGAPRIS